MINKFAGTSLQKYFAGRSAIITGSCGDGIGRSIALMLAGLGCNITLNYGTYNDSLEYEHRAQAVKSAIKELGRKAIIVKGNTGKDVVAQEIAQQTYDAFGRIDFLIINSGTNWDCKDIADLSVSQWTESMAIEIDAVYLLLKYTMPYMKKDKYGRVVMLGVKDALTITGNNEMALDYCLGRAARSWMTNFLGSINYNHNITFNIIEPGYIYSLDFETSLSYVKESLNGNIILSKEPNCHDVAQVACFLCSPLADHISRTVITIPTDTLPIDR